MANALTQQLARLTVGGNDVRVVWGEIAAHWGSLYCSNSKSTPKYTSIPGDTAMVHVEGGA